MKKEEWVTLKEKISELPLAEIIERTLSRLPEREGQVNDPLDKRFLCPFHEDHSGNHFGIYRGKDKEMWHCFVCDEKGDAFAFVQKVYKCDFKKAILMIAVDFGLITPEIYEKETKAQLNFVPNGSSVIHSYQSNLAPVASIKYRNLVYKTLQEMCPLSSEDRAYLNGRGIKDDEIRLYGYFTMPSEEALPRLINELGKQGFAPSVLIGVPGFYWDKAKKRIRMTELPGVAIPICNEDRQIEAVQVRSRGQVVKGARYKFLSSKFTDKPRFKEQYEKGCGPESTVGIAYPYEIDNLNRFVCITEGMFKATKFAKAFKAIGLTVQGVTNTKGVTPMLSRLEKRFHWESKRPVIVLAFDMDMYENKQVFKACRKLKDKLVEEGWEVRIAQWEEQWKGLDDFLLANPHGTGSSIKLAKFEKVEQRVLQSLTTV